jgi:hypothetical protein
MHRVPPLGHLLVTAGLLSEQALEDVLATQKTDGRRLGELLAEQGLVRPHQLAQALSHQLACPWVSLERIEIASEAFDVLPRDLALKHHMVPVLLRTSKGATALYVAMDDPSDDVALAEARTRTGMTVKPMVALASEIRTVLDRLYRAPRPSHAAIRPAKPPPPKATTEAIEDLELMEDAPPASGRAQVLIVDPSERVVRAVRAAFAEIGVECIKVQVSDLARVVEERSPALIVVDEATYESARAGVDTVALGTRLVVASAQVSAAQLGAFAVATFTQRASYEKGMIIDGRYELVRELGGRLPGSRWEVRHLRTGRRATMKIGVCSHRDETDGEAVRREAAALSRLRHPSIIDIRDAGNTDLGDPYLVLEALGGRTLEGLVAARGALDIHSACALVKDVADALALAHESGILHHEVTPEHVVICRDASGPERAKLVHWEAASRSDGAVQPSVDLAGLASCAFLALVGRERQDGENVAHTEELDPDLAHVIAGAIGGAHARRFESVRAFASALAEATPTGDRPTLLDARPQSEGRRHRRVWYRTPVRVEIPSVGAIDGRTEDVSEGGIFVVTRSPVPEGVPVTIRFALPLDGKIVSETGIVRWSRSIAEDGTEQPRAPRAIGIELVGPGEESLLQLARFVAGA